jgi:hypothetical protein
MRSTNLITLLFTLATLSLTSAIPVPQAGISDVSTGGYPAPTAVTPNGAASVGDAVDASPTDAASAVITSVALADPSLDPSAGLDDGVVTAYETQFVDETRTVVPDEAASTVPPGLASRVSTSGGVIPTGLSGAPSDADAPAPGASRNFRRNRSGSRILYGFLFRARARIRLLHFRGRM